MRLSLAPLAFAALLVGASPASATIITYDLDITFSGDTPSGFPTVTLNDFGAPGSVLMTITSTITPTEFIDDVYLNYDPTGNPTTELGFAYDSGVMVNSINTGINFIQADGDGKFDIVFDYPPPPGNSPNKFGAGQTSAYWITGTGLTVADFNFESVQGGGAGTFFAAAHIQSIGADGEGSGWVGDGDGPTTGPGNIVPEPSGLALMGLGMVLAVRRMRGKAR